MNRFITLFFLIPWGVFNSTQAQNIEETLVFEFITKDDGLDTLANILTNQFKDSLIVIGYPVVAPVNYPDLNNYIQRESIRFIEEVPKEIIKKTNIETIILGTIYEKDNPKNYSLKVEFYRVEDYELVNTRIINFTELELLNPYQRGGLIIEKINSSIIDKDGDEIPDSIDECPNTFGLIQNEGCRFDVNLAVVDGLASFIEERSQSKNRSFPFPPPTPSAMDVLGLNNFPDAMTLGDINASITDALNNCGYFEKKYHQIPGGFALVTRIEKINEDASSKKPPERWNYGSRLRQKFSLKKFMRSLFFSNPGFYRIIVFLVTDTPFHSLPDEALQEIEVANSWFERGYFLLEEDLKKVPLDNSFSCSVLIYEFNAPESGDSPFIMRPSLNLGRVHLINSKLYENLSK